MNIVQVKILNLGSKSYCIDLKQSATSIYREWLNGSVPVVIENKTLYWMASKYWPTPTGPWDDIEQKTSCEELILAFDIEKEEFDVMPHPVLEVIAFKHLNMNIFKKDGGLRFAETCSKTQLITINI